MEIEIKTYNSYYKEYSSDKEYKFKSILKLSLILKKYVIYNNWRNDGNIYFSTHNKEYRFY
jgi:hypothetical protein